MKVIQLSTYDAGQGAARAALRLHQALRHCGVDSSMRVAASSSGDAWVRAPRSKPRQALALLRSTASVPSRKFVHKVAAASPGLSPR